MDKKSGKFNRKRPNKSLNETDASEDESQGSEQTDLVESRTSKQFHKKSSSYDWEIMEGLKVGQKCESKPKKYNACLTKRRKWPMKGWHKRFFVLQDGMLTYSKSQYDIDKGKFTICADVGTSFVTYKKDGYRVDIDADIIYHLKAKTESQFEELLKQLRLHRLYSQSRMRSNHTITPDDQANISVLSMPVSPVMPYLDSRGNALHTLERGQSRVATWLSDTAGMELVNKDLNEAQSKLFKLGSVLEKLGSQSNSSLSVLNDQSFTELSNSLDRKQQRSSMRWMLKKYRKDPKKGLSTDKDNQQVFPCADLRLPDLKESLHISSSNPNLLTYHEENKMRPASMPDNWVATGPADLNSEAPQHTSTHLHQEFLELAKSVHGLLTSLSKSVTTEHENMRQATERERRTASLGMNASYIQSLRTALAESAKQNNDLRSKLTQIRDLTNVLSTTGSTLVEPEIHIAGMTSDPSWDGQSVLEFYDAAETLNSSQESSDEEYEVMSDNSDTEYTAPTSVDDSLQMKQIRSSRRSRLPMPRPETDLSLWGLMRKNIGKDLSKISMPVSLNEPVGMLQKMCEDLEYSELLDRAAETDDPYGRMVLIAAFSVSPYASTYYRAGTKPFNPLLGETYECIREDRGWRFVSEQVSHHPPISACFCESKNFIFSQDIRIKTKFWGKSLEIQPLGQVTVLLPKHKDHYTWNKVTSCVHNILGGNRWVDHYGECVIRNENNGITCKLKYAKTSYWSAERHEVYGTIHSPDGKVMRHLSGKCNEGIYCGQAQSAKCVWRPGAMPEDQHIYYGFTKFAIELNEIDTEQVHLYAPTDSRFRPDQRNLEKGKLQEAESEKLRIEQKQRELRKKREENGVPYTPKWFMKDEDQDGMYRYTGKYWELRKDPGFMKVSFDKLF